MTMPDIPNMELVLPLLVGLSAGFVFVLAGIAIGKIRRSAAVRLRPVGGADDADQLPTLVRDVSDSAIPTLDKAVKRWLPRKELLRKRLARTGRKISIGQFILTCAVVAAAAGAILLRIVGLPAALVVPLALSAGVGLPYMAITYMGYRRMDRFNRLFPEAIDIMVRGLRAGMPLGDSIQVVGREIAAPVGPEFRTIDQTVAVGQSLDVALTDAAKRITTQEFQFFVVCLALQRETGGNLSETLANLGDILRKRRQMRQKIKAMSSEGRASAWIIGLLPFIMFFLIMGVRADYVLPLFHDPRGIVMVIIGLVSIAIGITVMNKMMSFEI